jgi:hypothetical protein
MFSVCQAASISSDFDTARPSAANKALPKALRGGGRRHMESGHLKWTAAKT